MKNQKPTATRSRAWMVSNELRTAAWLFPRPQYELARLADVYHSTVSQLMNRIVAVRHDDPRVLRLAKVLGIPPGRAFTPCRTSASAPTPISPDAIAAAMRLRNRQEQQIASVEAAQASREIGRRGGQASAARRRKAQEESQSAASPTGHPDVIDQLQR